MQNIYLQSRVKHSSLVVQGGSHVLLSEVIHPDHSFSYPSDVVEMLAWWCSWKSFHTASLRVQRELRVVEMFRSNGFSYVTNFGSVFFSFMKMSKIWQPPSICVQLCFIDDCRLKDNLKHDRERKWFRTSVSGKDSTSPLRTARSYRRLIIFIV